MDGSLEFQPESLQINNNSQRNNPHIVDLIYQGEIESSGGQIYLNIPPGLTIQELSPEKGVYILYSNTDNSEIHYGRLQGKLVKGDKIMSLKLDFRDCTKAGNLSLDTKKSIVLSSEKIESNGFSFECNSTFIPNYVYIIFTLLAVLIVSSLIYTKLSKISKHTSDSK